MYLGKCIHTLFFMVKKHMGLTDNYGDKIKFIAEELEEPITWQYLQNCPRNATYVSNRLAKSLLDAVNSYYKAHQLKEIREAPFFSLTTDEAENSSHKECSLIFITYYSLPKSRVTNTFLGIVNLNGKTTSQIMDALKVFFEAKADFKEEFDQTCYIFILIVVITD